MSGLAVRVVIPAYRRPEPLRACLTALAAQTIADPWEVVVVDDGSPEPLEASLGDAVRPPNLRIVRQANAGPSAARNRGAREARGEFLAFTDDDCRPEPAWLGTLVQAARARPDALVGGTTLNGLPDDLFSATSQLIVDLVYEHFNADLENAFFLASNNILCRRDRFLSIGGFDETFPRAGAEDREFCDRWRVAGLPIVWLPGARIEHRHHQTLRKYLDLHFRYGRGARRYWAVREERGSGSMGDDLGFHRSLAARVWRRFRSPEPPQARLATLVALGAWQVANAAGFVAEDVSMRREGRNRGNTPPSGR
jgi:GT2 family glycosyltransferase